MSDDTQAFDQWWVYHVLPDGQRPCEWAGSVGIGVIAERAFNAGRRALEIIDTKPGLSQFWTWERVEEALTEARAQGAAEERERLAKCADAYSSTDLYDINDGGCQFLSRSEWRDTAQWLRSQKDQPHD